MCVNALHLEIDQLLAKEPEILARVRVGQPVDLTSPAADRSY
jgi:hypothetical protein